MTMGLRMLSPETHHGEGPEAAPPMAVEAAATASSSMAAAGRSGMPITLRKVQGRGRKASRAS